jgi:hypothetical protein
VADGFGLPAALTVLAFLTVPAVLLTLMLPRPQATRKEGSEEARKLRN